MSKPLSLLLFTAFLSTATADPTDWINVEYFSSQSSPYRHGQFENQAAERAIIQGADRLNKRGPYSGANGNGVAAPSEDPNDYLSWAPYHWPDCNWCGEGRTYLSDNPGNSSDANLDSEADTQQDNPDYQAGDSDVYGESLEGRTTHASGEHMTSSLHRIHRMIRAKRQASDLAQAALRYTLLADISDTQPTPTLPDSERPDFTESVYLPDATFLSPSATTYPVAGTQAPAQANAKNRHKQDKSKSSKCTPSPTTSMAPSATWTTCPYVIRDGKVNPDVRTLHGPGAINNFSQMGIYEAMAFLISSSAQYLDTLINGLNTFYLDDSTKLNPNMEYGQVSRGPGPKGKEGSFSGILDGRGHIKVVNAIMLIRKLKAPSWTREMDRAMTGWLSAYDHWLTSSALGKKALTRSNNHGTFFVAQISAVRLAKRDTSGARQVLEDFFDGAFQDQIAASGEQPFEAVRTRPYHYRCFNLEALITAAKIGEEIGLDLWSKKTKRGSTIQDALDFAMQVNPKREDARQIIPHVVAIKRAYGDPDGKYAAFLDKVMPSYRNKPFYLYNQASMPSRSKRAFEFRREDAPTLPFECPSVFVENNEVELEPGLWVTCEDLRPLFESSKLLPTGQGNVSFA